MLVVIGLLWPWFDKLGLGRLPGDIVIEGGGFRLYFPIVTCLIVSIVLSVILWLLRRWVGFAADLRRLAPLISVRSSP